VGAVIYRLVSNVAVVLGDPVCAPAAFAQVTRSFLDYCARQRWRVAFYQASPEHLASYCALKLRTFKMGEEAVLRPQNFTLHGSPTATPRFVTALARTSEGAACAFVTFTPIYGSLEVEATTTGAGVGMERRFDAPLPGRATGGDGTAPGART
jgi:Phosphatidylglycerol lysyltransferase, C-terminal